MEKEIISDNELREIWPILDGDDRVSGFRELDHGEAEEFFLRLSSRDQARLLLALPERERRTWIRLLAPDDAADVIQESPTEERERLLALLDDPTRAEVIALLAYGEDVAGGVM